ncbi:glutathione S-transferase family protein [Arenibaculum pallidiluteum]|uniref:glutathione S-transferase family protein n=1 Tax=Arenibaculum pallidiluteum TaxID=2812559 RepID=UPI001A956A8F|nr:glutathione S-transferase family protein [Arenibaculum pallidiluteum]
MSDLVLVIGNKAYSSWSLRPWLALKQAGIPFEEVVIPLRQPETKAEILAHSPAGKVPVLRHGELVLWESLAICEYVADLFPDAGLLPDDREARAVCRAVSSEMHAGFPDLRRNMPMDLKRSLPGRGHVPAALADAQRVQQLWRDARALYGAGGPFLFGRFSIADAMFAPVCTRFDTYGVELDPVSRAYVEVVLGLPAMRAWIEDARAEPWTIAHDVP